MGDYAEWPIVDFSGGMNDFVEDNLIADNQCSYVQNCISKTVGQLTSREGQKVLNATALAGTIQGIYSYYYGSNLENRKIIAVANGSAYVWSGTDFISIKAGLSATNPVLFATCVNYMVMLDGTAPFKYDGTNVTALTNAPLTSRCPVLHKEKLFVIEDFDTVRWSDSFAPETWPAVNVWNFDTGDGDELSMIVSLGRELLACKKRKLYSLSGNSLDDFRSDCVDKQHGVVGPRAGIALDPYFYYVSYDGVMKWDGLQSQDLISKVIPHIWEKVDQANISKAVAGYNDKFKQLWFWVPEIGNANGMVLAYDLKYESWWVHRGIHMSCVSNFNSGSEMKIYTGHNTLGQVVEQNVGFNDLGAAISCDWIGKNYDAGDPVRMKKFKKVFAVDDDGMADATFQYRLDGGTWTLPAARTDRNNARKYRLSRAKCRYFQPGFTHNVLNEDFCLSGMKSLFILGPNK